MFKQKMVVVSEPVLLTALSMLEHQARYITRTQTHTNEQLLSTVHRFSYCKKIYPIHRKNFGTPIVFQRDVKESVVVVGGVSVKEDVVATGVRVCCSCEWWFTKAKAKAKEKIKKEKEE